MSIDIKEKKAVQGLLAFLPERPVVFDVGSNKGEWSDIIMEEFGQNCDINFFEPNRIMLDYTRIKYDYNTNIAYNQLAVADNSDVTIPFYFFENKNNGLSSIHYNEIWEKEGLPMQKRLVDTITIEDYCKRNDIKIVDLLKIDVEGAEMEVIAGCGHMLQDKAIRIIQLEYGAHYKLNDYKFYDILYTTSLCGYNCYSFDGENYIPVTTQNFVEDYRAENFILTTERIENTQDWNREFIENTKGIGKIGFALEVGCFEGRTTKYICENLLLPEGRMICVDPLNDYYIEPGDIDYFKSQYYRFKRNTKGLPVDLIRKKSRDAWGELYAFRFDLIFIDGDHSEAEVYNDAVKGFDVCRVDGYMLFDDYIWSEGTKRAIDAFLYHIRGRYELLVNGYQILIKKTIDYY